MRCRRADIAAAISPLIRWLRSLMPLPPHSPLIRRRYSPPFIAATLRCRRRWLLMPLNAAADGHR
jgi:hypothetical protein